MIWSIWLQGEQDNGVSSSQTEIHPSLQASFLPYTHINVGNDVIAQKSPTFYNI